jgi:hypothetical protein
VDADLDGEGVVVDAKALEQRELAELGVGARLGEPPTEHAAAREVRDPPHGGLPLAFLPLVVVGRHEDPPHAAAPAAEQRALLHCSEHPVALPEVVAVEQCAELGRVERLRGLVRLRRRVAQARGRLQGREIGRGSGEGADQVPRNRGGAAAGRGEGGIHQGLGIWIVLGEGRSGGARISVVTSPRRHVPRLTCRWLYAVAETRN